MCLVSCKNQQPKTALETLVYGAPCKTRSDMVLLDTNFLEVLKTMFTFAESFEVEYGSPFTESETEDNAAEFISFNFLPGAGLAICKRQFWVTITMLVFPERIGFVYDDARNVISSMHLDEMIPATFENANSIVGPLHSAAQPQKLTYVEKSNFLSTPFTRLERST